LPNFGQGKNSEKPEYAGLVERIRDVLGVKNQKEIAEILDVAPASVSGWKKGSISVDNLVQIQKLVNASISWLLTGKGSKFLSSMDSPLPEAISRPVDPLSKKITSLLEDCKSLSGNDKKLILHHVEILHHEVSRLIENYSSEIHPVPTQISNIDMPELIDKLRADYPNIKAKDIYRVVDMINIDEIDPKIVSIVRQYAGIPEDGETAEVI
jgi:hypothetical protein